MRDLGHHKKTAQGLHNLTTQKVRRSKGPRTAGPSDMSLGCGIEALTHRRELVRPRWIDIGEWEPQAPAALLDSFVDLSSSSSSSSSICRPGHRRYGARYAALPRLVMPTAMLGIVIPKRKIHLGGRPTMLPLAALADRP